jgi:hypothetical protein
VDERESGCSRILLGRRRKEFTSTEVSIRLPWLQVCERVSGDTRGRQQNYAANRARLG